MALHLGNGISVPASDILAILDLEGNGKNFQADLLDDLNRKGLITVIGAKSKSLVLVSRGGRAEKLHGCLSPISVRTLRERVVRESANTEQNL